MAVGDGELEDVQAELEAYKAEDPSGLSVAELREVARAFGLPLSRVRAIAAGMSRLRNGV